MQAAPARFAVFAVTFVVMAAAQAQRPSMNESAPAMTPEQKASFDDGQKSFAGGQWTDALTRFRTLHQQLPENRRVAEFTAEAALNTGDTVYALSLLKPMASVSNEWEAHLLLARAYAESNADAARDAELRQLVALHTSTADQRFARLTEFLVQRLPAAGGHIDLFYSLTPWSRYSIYELARVYDGAGKQVQRIALESSDADQRLWAEQHPDLAAKGLRGFSLDGYVDQGDSGGQVSQTHSTYGFFDGRPDYNTVRDRMVSIAQGKSAAISSTVGIHPR